MATLSLVNNLIDPFPAANTLPVLDPATDELLAEVPKGTAAEARAVASEDCPEASKPMWTASICVPRA